MNTASALRFDRQERGGALIELAISIPIFLAILALIFDAGMGFSAARTTSSASRSAARVAALAGDDRLADFRALDAVRSEFANNDDTVLWVSIYRTEAAADGQAPAGCGRASSGVPGLCNTYDGAVLGTLVTPQFGDPDCVGDPDENWCPTTRRDNDGDYLGVAVWSAHDPTIGLIRQEEFVLEDRAVFALYFRDSPVLP